jgi:hypothetical protein
MGVANSLTRSAFQPYWKQAASFLSLARALYIASGSNEHQQLATGAGVSWKVIGLNVFAMAIWTIGVFASLYADT